MSDDTFAQYLEVKRLIAERRVWDRAQADLRTEISRVNQELGRQAVQVSRQALQQQLRRQFPNAYQCGRCGHGPIDHMACYDLQAHHGEQHGAARISNACPRCNWFSPEISHWPKWNGTLPDDVDATTGEDTVRAQIPNVPVPSTTEPSHPASAEDEDADLLAVLAASAAEQDEDEDGDVQAALSASRESQREDEEFRAALEVNLLQTPESIQGMNDPQSMQTFGFQLCTSCGVRVRTPPHSTCCRGCAVHSGCTCAPAAASAEHPGNNFTRVQAIMQPQFGGLCQTCLVQPAAPGYPTCCRGFAQRPTKLNILETGYIL